MKNWIISTLLGFSAPAAFADQVLIIGDSLSKEYEIEFATDNYPDRVKSWTEILDDLRNDDFDYGSLNSVAVPVPFTVVPGHEYNWSWPGGVMEDFVDLVEGRTFFDNVARDLLEDRIEDVERVVFFVGGNDVDSVYQTAYEGRSIESFTGRFIEETETVLDYLIDEAPGREIVMVSIPHVGATPDVKSDHPFDPVLTGNATAAYAVVEAEMRALAEEKGVGYVDIFSLTVPLLDDDDYCFQGVGFENQSAADGRQERLWLGGPVAADFHPNTLLQAEIANAIIDGFNERYDSGIRRLTTREILETLTGRDADVTYAEWALCFGVGGISEDEDGDGLPNGIEFGTGGSPLVADTGLFSERVTDAGVEIVFRKRVDTSAFIEMSSNLENWMDFPADKQDDGEFRAFLPVGSGRGFLRLVVP